MKLTFKIFAVALFTALALSCSKGDDSNPSPSGNISVSLRHASVDAASGTQFADIVCSGKWTVSCPADWITLSANSGSGDASVAVSYKANETKVSRTATITLTAAGKSAIANLVQKGVSVTPKANVTTSSPGSITKVGATLNGSFSGATSAPREVGFEFGETSSMGQTYQVSTTPTSTSGSFTYNVTGLGEGKTYYYRAYVIIQEGDAILTFYGNTISFATLGGTVNPSGNQKGWYELPVMTIATSGNYMYNPNNEDLYYAYHYTDLKVSGKNARNYTVCFSAQHHCPVWVAAPRHSMYVGSSGRSDAYKKDPDIPGDIQYNSKDIGGGCNKGHMLGSAERTASRTTNEQVFYYSNIAPQLSGGFNTGGGGWNLLEDYVDTQVCSDTLYVVIGCYFENYTDAYGKSATKKTISFGGRTDVSRPTMFYYLLMRTKSGNSGKALKDCSASEIQCVAFVRAHSNDLKGQRPSSQELMSVADLERITGFSYFPNVPNAPKTTFSASDWGL